MSLINSNCECLFSYSSYTPPQFFHPTLYTLFVYSQSSLTIASMHISIEPFTGAWAAYQQPYLKKRTTVLGSFTYYLNIVQNDWMVLHLASFQIKFVYDHICERLSRLTFHMKEHLPLWIAMFLYIIRNLV